MFVVVFSILITEQKSNYIVPVITIQPYQNNFIFILRDVHRVLVMYVYSTAVLDSKRSFVEPLDSFHLKLLC